MEKESKRKVILIGGAPTAGKSTMAGLIAKKLNIPWISTDQIREIMRVTARRVVSQLFDTVIFATIAFYGVVPLLPIIVGGYIVKVAVALIDTPFAYALCHITRKIKPASDTV